MRTYIKINPNLRLEMKKHFGVTGKCIWENLNGLVKSDLGDQIRSYALANGGKMICETYVPNCTTVKQEEGFAQIFPNGVTVVVNTQANAAWIMKGNEVLHRYNDVTMNKLTNILWLAEEISKTA